MTKHSIILRNQLAYSIQKNKRNKQWKKKVPLVYQYLKHEVHLISFLVVDNQCKLDSLRHILGNIDKQVVTLVTQVEVAGDDQAFNNPTKPIGLF
jgi:carbamate kinase